MIRRRKRLRSRTEIEKEFRDELDLLKEHVFVFDAGNEKIYREIVRVLYVLLYDRGTSISLLRQLGKMNHRFTDTSGTFSKSQLAPGDFVMQIAGSVPAKFKAPLDSLGGINPATKVHFEKWWTKLVLFDQKGNTFSRKELVVMIRNQEGVAHFDPEIDEAYADLDENIGWKSSPDNTPVEGAALAAIRQIAHEVLKSFPEAQAAGTTQPMTSRNDSDQ